MKRVFNPIQMGLLGAGHGSEKGKKLPPSLKSVTHILQCWNLAQLYLSWRRSKKYMNQVTQPLSSAASAFFTGNQGVLPYKEMQMQIALW